jgi:uncharacterized 2Fe-2S/4Fe-4S cluster protein (DUF4445 family)
VSPRFGLAVDVGTTTLVLELVDLATGELAAHTSAANPQARMGTDVMTRIAHAQAAPAHVHELHSTLLNGLHALIDEALHASGDAQARAERRDSEHARAEISDAVFVGNATMVHTLIGMDPTALGTTPYRGALEAGWQGEARQIGLDLPHATVYVPPGIRSHVGADTVAGILATELDTIEGPALFIDLGTNSEVVLVHAAGMLCTSTAAGPAFESASPENRLRGSQLISAVAERLRTGTIAPSGKLSASDDAVSQEEIRQLQLAKAGVAAGVRVLLARAGLQPPQLEAVILAGAFGNYLVPQDALSIGLLPDVPPERVRFVGNAALEGARLLLTDAGARRRADAVAARARYIELGGHQGYGDAFVEEIPFPTARGRLLGTLSQLAGDMAQQSLRRCPYRGVSDRCTFRGPCRNRVRLRHHPARCGGGPLNSSPV